jgi:hypothetical protein
MNASVPRRGQITTRVGGEIGVAYLILSEGNAERMRVTQSGSFETTCFGFNVSRVPESGTRDATSRVYG